MIDRETLIKARLPERVVALPGVGEIRVRGLSRAEVLACQGIKDDQAAFEARVLSLAMVDPALSEDDVIAWREAALYGEAEAALDAISDLSKLGEGAAKSGVSGVPGAP